MSFRRWRLRRRGRGGIWFDVLIAGDMYLNLMNAILVPVLGLDGLFS
jgi:hypothetical protein